MIRILILIPFLFFATVQAQDKEDKVAIRSVIGQFFSAMFSGDTVRLAGILEPSATLSTINASAAGGNSVTVTTRTIFFRSIRTLHTDMGLNECLVDWDFFVDAQGATVVCPYHFFAKHVYSHSGTDTFILRRSASGWKIVSVSDTRYTLDRAPKHECD